MEGNKGGLSKDDNSYDSYISTNWYAIVLNLIILIRGEKRTATKKCSFDELAPTNNPTGQLKS